MTEEYENKNHYLGVWFLCTLIYFKIKAHLCSVLANVTTFKKCLELSDVLVYWVIMLKKSIELIC